MAQDGRIGGQNEAYRKGLVFGLTLAEVGLLIIFVLLLLIASEAIDRQRTAQRLREAERLAESRLSELTQARQLSEVVTQELGLGPNPNPKDVRRLVRAARAAQAGTAQSALTEMRRELEDKEGQLQRYEEQLQTAGLGKGERPCWVRPDGTIEYLYEVVLASGGIRMREVSNPERLEQRQSLPMPPIDDAATLTPAEFVSLTKPLYDTSLAKNCRFFVAVYDETEAHEKSLYKSLLQTVEGHFYKRLSSADPPF